MKTKNYPLLFLFLLTALNSFSQEKIEEPIKEKSEFWNKVRFGGGLGLDFSSNVTSVSVSPSAIYLVSNKFSTGAGINFGYQSFKVNSTKQFNYGVSLINLYNPFEGLQLSGELEYTFVNQSQKFDGVKSTRDFNFPSLFIGAGYSIGRYFSVGFKYDLLYNDDESIYGSALVPFARVFF